MGLPLNKVFREIEDKRLSKLEKLKESLSEFEDSYLELRRARRKAHFWGFAAIFSCGLASFIAFTRGWNLIGIAESVLVGVNVEIVLDRIVVGLRETREFETTRTEILFMIECLENCNKDCLDPPDDV